MLRPIDAYTLNNALVSLYNNTEDETEKSILRRVMQMVVHAPTLNLPNELLTMEQLREMDGEPVWCEWLLDADRRIEYGAWFIVVVGEYGLELKKPLDFGCYVCKNENYGTEWLAYRRPPEGELKYDGRL